MEEGQVLLLAGGLLLLGYIIWLRFRIWYLKQIFGQTTVVVANPNTDASNDSNGCATTMIIVTVIAFFPIAALLQWFGLG